MAKDICAATGERIRKLRRARNWRQIDLAEQSGVHKVHISDLERGTREQSPLLSKQCCWNF
jgi:transcriptional regulator with XRE-family HTH domain